MIVNFADWREEYKRELSKDCRLGYYPDSYDEEALRDWYNEGLTPAQAADEEMEAA